MALCKKITGHWPKGDKMKLVNKEEGDVIYTKAPTFGICAISGNDIAVGDQIAFHQKTGGICLANEYEKLKARKLADKRGAWMSGLFCIDDNKDADSAGNEAKVDKVSDDLPAKTLPKKGD